VRERRKSSFLLGSSNRVLLFQHPSLYLFFLIYRVQESSKLRKELGNVGEELGQLFGDMCI